MDFTERRENVWSLDLAGCQSLLADCESFSEMLYYHIQYLASEEDTTFKRKLGETFEVAEPPSVTTESGHLILKLVMSLVRDEYGAVPKEYWGLSRSTDLTAPRGFLVGNGQSYERGIVSD